MTPSSLTLGPAQGRLLLRTGVEGRAAKLGHRLTLGIGSWQCVVEGESVVVELDLASMQVISGEGGVKPLSEGDRRKVLEGAAKTLPRTRATWTSAAVTATDGGYDLAGALDLNGVTRPCDVAVTVDGGRATARASVSQRAHGIEPYSQGFGSLQVSDVVQVLVEVSLPTVTG